MVKQSDYSQATREYEGATQYGWRPGTDTVWNPSEVVWTGTTVAPPGYVPWLVYTINYATKKGAGSGRWGVCPTCLEEFPISDMIRVRGKYYCTKYRDYEEQL